MSQHNNSVILVEDNMALREALEHHLRDAGFSTRGVGDGQELNQELAISMPDVIVLDLNLPEEDGLSICKRRKLAALPYFIAVYL